jgi:hypothetical protein
MCSMCRFTSFMALTIIIIKLKLQILCKTATLIVNDYIVQSEPVQNSKEL